MRTIPAQVLVLVALLTLALPGGATPDANDPREVDLFAVAIQAARAIPEVTQRSFTLGKIALAWARTDLCREALVALEAGGKEIGAEPALEAALICSETVADETARQLLDFARGRIDREPDPMKKALYLASLGGAFAQMEQEEDRNAAAAQAAAALPPTCVPLEAVSTRSALALRFLDQGMEAWAAPLLAGAARVALDLPGAPVVLDGIWGPDDTPQRDLTDAVMGHLRFYADDAPGFSPPAPLRDCPAREALEDGGVATEKPVALAAVSTVLRRMGDAENAALARTLASTMIWGIRDPDSRARATEEAASWLADEAPAEDTVAFLLAVAAAAPAPTRKVFTRMVFTGGLRTQMPTETFLQSILSLAASSGPREKDADWFRAALARALLGLGDPERAHDTAGMITKDELRRSVFLQVLPQLARVDSGRAIIACGALTGGWKAAALYRIGAALERHGDEDDAAEALRRADEVLPKQPKPTPGDVQGLLAFMDTAKTRGGTPDPGTLESARKLAVAIPDNAARNALLEELGGRYLRRGEADRALGLARRMEGKKRDRLLWSIAMHQLDPNPTAAAIETILAIRNPGHRARALAEAALRLTKSGATLDTAGEELLQKMAR